MHQHGSGTSLIQIAEHFAASPEFAARYGNLNDEQFVELVYRNALNRESDPDGANYWIGKLGSELSRREMMLYFSESEENTN